FSPTTIGAESGAVWVSASTGGWHHHDGSGSSTSATVVLSGSAITSSGAGVIAPSPASLSFGILPAGGSQTLTETLTNTGTSGVNISSVGVSSAAFTVSGLSLPASLASGHSLTFSVAFVPVASGTASGNLVITSDASNSQLNIPVSGSETAPGQ